MGRNEIRRSILADNKRSQRTVTLPPPDLLKLESLLHSKITSKYSNVFSGLKKAIASFDLDRSGSLELGEFGRMIGGFINGVKEEDVLSLCRMYDYEQKGAVRNKDFLDRMLRDDVGERIPVEYERILLRLQEEKENKVLGEERELPPPPPPRPVSELAMTGDVSNRLKKFRSSVKNLIASKAPAARRRMKVGERMTQHSSSIDSDLVSDFGRSKLRELFSKVGGWEGGNLGLEAWSKVFQFITRSPTQPSLHPDDLKALHDTHGGGNVEQFIDSLFPPKVSATEMMRRVPGGDYKLSNDCDVGNQEVGRYAFDPDGEGERRVLKPTEISVPKRINYRYSRTPVAPPTSFDVNTVSMSGRLPRADLELSHVQGFRGDCDARNLYATKTGASDGGPLLVFTLAALAVVYDYRAEGQTFFRGHDDDITCLSVFEPDARAHVNGVRQMRAATGQMGHTPYVCIWEVHNVTELYRLGLNIFERSVCGVSFSYDGKHVAAIGMDDNHQICVWNLVGGKDRDTDEIIPKLLVREDTQTGTPPMLSNIVWCGFKIPNPEMRTATGKGSTTSRVNGSTRMSKQASANSRRSKENSQRQEMAARQGPTMQALVTVGKGKHLKIWTFDTTPRKNNDGSFKSPLKAYIGKFNNAPASKTLYSCVPICSPNDPEVGDIVAVAGETGASKLKKSTGIVYLFRMSTATCVSFVEAHPQHPCFSLAFESSSRILYSGGGDGMIRPFSVSVGKLEPLNTNGINLNPPARKKPSMLAHPESLHNDATIKASRRTFFRNNDGKKKNENRRGEGDELIKAGQGRPKIKHLVVVEESVGGKGEECETRTFLGAGLSRGSIKLLGLNSGTKHRTICMGHSAHVYGLAVHPTRPHLFSTVGVDSVFHTYDIKTQKCLHRATLPTPAKSLAYSQDAKHVAFGGCNGALLIVEEESLKHGYEFGSDSVKILAFFTDCEEDIDDLKYSPDDKSLAVGSHDNFIDVYDRLPNNTYRRKWRMSGHTSYITHLDWSKDSSVIQSNDGAYEILYWDVKNGRQIRSTMDTMEADTDWQTWTCVLGFPVMGIWAPASDGTDVNALDVDTEKNYIVTADDFGSVNLIRYPAVVKAAACKKYSGHAAHVMNVRFAGNGDYVVSVGGKDRMVAVWKVNRNLDTEDVDAKPKPRIGSRWIASGGWDMGRPLEYVGRAHEMTDLIANENNPRACGWIMKGGKAVLVEPDIPYGGYKGRYNDYGSSRA